MSLLDRLLGRRGGGAADIERAYIARCVTAGVPERDAQRLFLELSTLARARIPGSSDPTLPSDAGDRILRQEATNEAVRRNLKTMRDDGASDDDIRGYWNLSEFERAFIQVDDECSRAGLYVAKREDEGLTDDQAAAAVRRAFPIYGSRVNGREPKGPPGDDRTLTPELHARVDAWVRRRTAEDLERLRADIEGSTSMNALIRRELRAGNL